MPACLCLPGYLVAGLAASVSVRLSGCPLNLSESPCLSVSVFVRLSLSVFLPLYLCLSISVSLCLFQAPHFL